jgi:hypothetical protein
MYTYDIYIKLINAKYNYIHTHLPPNTNIYSLTKYNEYNELFKLFDYNGR